GQSDFASATTRKPRDEPLEPVIGGPGAVAHHAGHLVGEAEALLTDRFGHRRTLRDLFHQEPQPIALEQPKHGLVDEAAVNHPADEPFGLRTIDCPADEPVKDLLYECAGQDP